MTPPHCLQGRKGQVDVHWPAGERIGYHSCIVAQLPSQSVEAIEEQQVITGATFQNVAAFPTIEHVVALPAEEAVHALFSEHRVVPLVTKKGVESAEPMDFVVAAAAEDLVDPCIAEIVVADQDVVEI